MRYFIAAILLSLLFSYGSVFSQTVNEVYFDDDGNVGYSVLALDNGYWIVGTGYAQQFANNTAIKLMRIDKNGALTAKKIYGKLGRGYISGYTGAFQKLSNDSVYVLFATEFIDASLSSNAMIYWFNELGDTIRTQRITSNHLNRWLWHGIELKNKDLLAVGYAKQPNQNRQTLLICLDSLGNVRWENSYGGTGSEECRVIISAHNSGYLLAGTSNSFGGGTRDGYLVKVDTLGNIEWEKVYGTNWREASFRVLPSVDGNYYIWWVAEDDDMSNGVPSYEMRTYIGKIDSVGSALWTRVIHQDFSNWAYLNQLEEIDEGRHLIGSGEKKDPITGVTSGWITKLDSSGNIVWEQYYVNDSNAGLGAYLYDHNIASNGDVVCTGGGNTQGSVFANQLNYWLLVVDSMGCLIPGCDTIIGINETPLSNISLYPNPATDQLYIKLPDNIRTAQLELYSLLGAKLLQSPVHHQTPIDISQLPKGMYVYRVQVGSSIHNGKLLIE